MAIEKARAYLAERGYGEKVLEFDVSSATGELAAKAVGVEPARITKTLSFLVDDKAVLICCAGDTRIDNRAFKGQFHTKAKMLSGEQAVELVGHAPGGVCPFGTNDGVETYLDVSMRRFETVFPACGSSNSAIELTPDELETLAQGFCGWIDVCKGWREEA